METILLDSQVTRTYPVVSTITRTVPALSPATVLVLLRSTVSRTITISNKLDLEEN